MGVVLVALNAPFVLPRRPRPDYHTYRLHCHSQLVWSAGFAGRSQVALDSAAELIASTPASLRYKYADTVEPLAGLVWSALVRFGRWVEILARPEPPSREEIHVGNVSVAAVDNFVSVAMARWAKGVAAAVLGHLDAAANFRQSFRQAAAAVPPTRHIHTVSSSRSLAVASKLLDGEIMYRQAGLQHAQARRGAPHQPPHEPLEAAPEDIAPDPDAHAATFAEAFTLLREAMELDESLPYDEPWGWHSPVAHALGALLFEQGQVSEAAEVYKRDLARWPGNMWALHGLRQCLEAGVPVGPNPLPPAPSCCAVAAEPAATAELADVVARLHVAAAHADVTLAHSCFCAGLQPPHSR